MNALVSYQQNVAALYRRRARACLNQAKRALIRRQLEAAQAWIDEARTWTKFAGEWARQARSVSAERSH